MISKKIEEFIECLNDERYYDAHEALEEVWFPRRFEKSNEVKVLKGFINASVSFELIKRGREKQSNKVWANYLKYRPLLLCVESSHKNEFYKLSRVVEEINHKKKYLPI